MTKAEQRQKLVDGFLHLSSGDKDFALELAANAVLEMRRYIPAGLVKASPGVFDAVPDFTKVEVVHAPSDN